ncbi:hypothetical protein UJ101_00393 [Flavobacteriaceae bacterium UJ101]|nr:hypothetical protein UJ101_00393 [Flavobacteriaceae bacterium UJ101]
MKPLLYSILTYFIFTPFFFSQERELLQGRIEIDLEGESPEGIQIVNTNTSQKVTTDVHGYFKIPIQLDDILHVYSNDFEERRYTITAKNIETKKVIIHLNIEPNMIEEVVVSQLKFTGDLAKDVKNNRDHLKSYKQQQIIAKVKPTDLSTGEFTPINISQGYRSKFKLKTAAHKKRLAALEYRGELETQLQIQYYFDEDFYTETLQIPQKEIQNFIVYCCAKSNIKELAQSNQFIKIQLKLIDLAPQYIAQMKNALNDQSYNEVPFSSYLS